MTNTEQIPRAQPEGFLLMSAKMLRGKMDNSQLDEFIFGMLCSLWTW